MANSKNGKAWATALLWIGSVVVSVLLTYFATSASNAAFQQEVIDHMKEEVTHENEETKLRRIDRRVDAKIGPIRTDIASIKKTQDRILYLLENGR